MFNMSASEGPKFAETVDEMTNRLRELGPSPLRGDQPPKKVEAALTDSVVSDKEEGETK